MKTLLIITLLIIFVVVVVIRTRRNMQWVSFGEEFGKKGEQLVLDYEYLLEHDIVCRIERGLPVNRLLRPLAKNLDDRVALYVHKNDVDRAKQLLG